MAFLVLFVGEIRPMEWCWYRILYFQLQTRYRKYGKKDIGGNFQGSIFSMEGKNRLGHDYSQGGVDRAGQCSW